jgi:enamine deaminase RidA (YjgF/YER057c/UK114 family)
MIRARLAKLGLNLPAAPEPVGAYQAAVVRDGLGMVSGQFPLRAGRLVWQGAVGAELSSEQGQEAARLAALNALAHIDAVLVSHGGWACFAGLLRLEGHVASAPGFLAQPQVLNAASELLVAVLGDELGAHSRSAFAPTQLPLGAPIELVLSFAVTEAVAPRAP